MISSGCQWEENSIKNACNETVLQAFSSSYVEPMLYSSKDNTENSWEMWYNGGDK